MNEKNSDIDDKNTIQASDSQKTADRPVKKAISRFFPPTPTPLEKPTIDEDFNDLSAIERATEAIKYNILCLV